MSDQASADGGQADQQQPTHDWEKDYKELQATFTQSQQRLRDLERVESDRDAYIALGAKHGFEFEFDDQAAGQQQGQPVVDPELAALREQVAEQAAWKQEVETERQQRQFEEGRQAVHAQHDEWAKDAGIKLADFDHAAIIQRAIDSGATTLEEAKGIFDSYVAHKTAEREAILAEAAEARRRPRVPSPPPGGQAATAGKAMHEMTRAERDEYALERLSQ